MVRILFVCMGNICRSPAAENILRQKLQAAGLEKRVEVDSAGTIGFHQGKSPDPRMRRQLEKRGYPTAGQARQVQESDLDTHDWILCADQENLADLHHLDFEKRHRSKIRLVTDFCRESSADRVPDPYHGGDRGFKEVIDLVEDACDGIIAEIVGSPS